MKRMAWAVPTFGLLTLVGCQMPPSKPIQTVDFVDLERFMGDWYVVAHIPTFIEKDSYNAVESYRLAEDGNIETTFTFREGGFDGKLYRYQPIGYVEDTQTNAVWGMQFLWPFRADYRVIYLNDDYSQTVIGRNQRDYVWVMARTPAIPEADYDGILVLLREQGYDVSKLRKVPQRWG